jgi:hypothetical protein
MNKRVILSTIFILFLFSISIMFGNDYEKLLKANDVEKVLGIQKIQLVPKNPQIGAGGDLNFALEDKTLILMVSVQKASLYNEWKNQEGFFHAEVSDIGDEAFEGPSFGNYRYILIFRKGKKAISLSSFFNMKAGGEPFISQEKLREIAKTVISRL